MNVGESSERSAEACPVCGQHRLHLLYFPDIDVSGVRPYDELLALSNPRPDQPPGIGCAACGSQWESVEAFRAGANAR